MAPQDRAHAHRARFARGVERAAAQRRVAVISETAPDRHHLAVRGRVMIRPPQIAPARNDRAVAHSTAPKGKSAWRASSSAMRMNRTSSAEAGAAACACAPVGATAAAASPARTKRRLGAAIASRHAQCLCMSTPRQALDDKLAARELFPRAAMLSCDKRLRLASAMTPRLKRYRPAVIFAMLAAGASANPARAADIVLKAPAPMAAPGTCLA